jgi:hypothetical protein
MNSISFETAVACFGKILQRETIVKIKEIIKNTFPTWLSVTPIALSPPKLLLYLSLLGRTFFAILCKKEQKLIKELSFGRREALTLVVIEAL